MGRNIGIYMHMDRNRNEDINRNKDRNVDMHMSRCRTRDINRNKHIIKGIAYTWVYTGTETWT